MEPANARHLSQSGSLTHTERYHPSLQDRPWDSTEGRDRRNHFLRSLTTAADKLGVWVTTLVLTSVSVGMAIGLRLLLESIENRPFDFFMFINVALVNGLVALPIALYLQRLIHHLSELQKHRNELSAGLAVALRRAEDANKAKSAFLANMSHELRTPLNAIIGFSEIIRDQHLLPADSKRYSEYAGDIHDSGQHLLAIINDILDLSKIEAGAMRLDDAKAFELDSAIEASLRIVAPIAKKQKVILERVFEVPGLRIVGAERMIRQILINIITNAVKFTPAGGKVRISGQRNATNAVTVIITDTGVGMSDDDIVKALLPFSQVSNVMSNKHKGTGLGLPLAKAMLELHGGTFQITSVPFEGTSVSLGFPAARVIIDNTSSSLPIAV